MIETYNPESQMVVSMTESAIKHGKSKLEKNNSALGIRLSLKKTGCSGYSYVTDYATSIEEGDVVFDQPEGLKVIVDKSDLPILGGTIIDFQKKGLNAVFTFQNPNSKGECGCGESFSA